MRFISVVAASVGLAASVAFAQPVTTAFTYQGELSQSGGPAEGVYDLRFRLFTAASGGSVVGSVLCSDNVAVSGGRFTVVLDFGAQYAGQQRFLEIEVRPDTGAACGAGGGYTLLSPRQELTITPYAGYALASGNAALLNGQGPTYYGNAGNLSSGTLPAARLGPTVFQTGTNNTVTGTNLFMGPTSFSNPSNVFYGDGSNLSGVWKLGGNAGTTSSHFVGTTDAQPLTLRTANMRAWQTEWVLQVYPGAPWGTVNSAVNILAGSPLNSISSGITGATISGGGGLFSGGYGARPNRVTDFGGTIGGGFGNQAGNENSNLSDAGLATVGGGVFNRAEGPYSAVCGGWGNRALEWYAFVGGGSLNLADYGAVVSGGIQNQALNGATVAGGYWNLAHGLNSSIGGGYEQRAQGEYSTVPGGKHNESGGNHSFASGHRAKVRDAAATGDANGDEGTFIWADSTDADFISTGPNQFLIRAGGGVAINTTTPAGTLTVAGSTGVANTVTATQPSTSGNVSAIRGTITSATAGAFSAGVRGVNNGTGALGVGVFGSHAAGGYGVYGTAGAAGWAGYFDGRVNVNGAFSATSKAFRIDHPLDPANKELWHSCVESPDMMNIYTGEATTGEDGYATITLPGYFEALNRDYRYSLTVIDDDPNTWTLAKVTREISGNTFEIRTSVGQTRVSWLVTGVRKDAFAEKHRIVPEQDKPAERRGTYLNPEAFGRLRVVPAMD
ncbi:MAG: hypothetical protein JNK25_07435 [Phycisphaerae bacterium]|nr:hypothetical protein [Phycisphaerae bacterium]